MDTKLERLASLEFTQAAEKIRQETRQATAKALAGMPRGGQREALELDLELEEAEKLCRAYTQIWTDLLERHNGGYLTPADVKFISEGLQEIVEVRKNSLQHGPNLHANRAAVAGKIAMRMGTVLNSVWRDLEIRFAKQQALPTKSTGEGTVALKSKKEIIRELISDARQFPFCGPSADPDEQSAVTLGYQHLLIQFQRLAGPLLPETIASQLNTIEIDVNDIYSAFKARAELDALLPDIEAAIPTLGESRSRNGLKSTYAATSEHTAGRQHSVPTMLLTSQELKIADLVIDKFLSTKEPSKRIDLVRQFPDEDMTDLLERMVRYSILKNKDGREYLPLSLAFEYCTNSTTREQAKISTQAVLGGLYVLFMDRGHPEDREYAVSEVEEAAKQTGIGTKDISVSLGLYLIQDYGVLQGFRGNDYQTEISHVRISENIARVKPATAWDSHVRGRSEYLERQRGPERRDDLLLKLYEAWNARKRKPLPSIVAYEIASGIQLFNGEHRIVIDELAAEGLLTINGSGDISLTSKGITRLERQNAVEKLQIKATDPKKVFLVHGQNNEVKQTVARFLERHGLDVTILHEKANKGRTLIEKFVEHSDVGFAVVLLTPDDFGGSIKRPKKKNKRARQNVILELGFFIGKLGRPRVCAIYSDGVELPSDFDGVLYIPYDRHDGWRLKLLDELRAAEMRLTERASKS